MDKPAKVSIGALIEALLDYKNVKVSKIYGPDKNKNDKKIPKKRSNK